jgi:hypothetical protein
MSNADVVAILENGLERLGALKEYVVERETLAEDAEARSFSLPSADAADKILRYEAQLDRQLYRAMYQVERLQRQRKGENVPSPLNINLSRRSYAFLRNKAKKLFNFSSWSVDLWDKAKLGPTMGRQKDVLAPAMAQIGRDWWRGEVSE